MKESKVSEEALSYMWRLVCAVRFHYRETGGSYAELDPIQQKHKELADKAFAAFEKWQALSGPPRR